MNQRGITLVELLGALTLVFLIGTGIFMTLTHSFNLFQREADRIDVRAQANTIINQLTTFYQENDELHIENRDGKTIITSGDDRREFYLPSHQIRVEPEGAIQMTHEGAANSTNQFISEDFTIIIENTEGEELFKLTTTVSRLKEG